jgi:predicted cupin superfamily sugar epimerase
MRVAIFNLPLADNSGNALNDVHAALQADIVDAFGGFTLTHGQGGWRDDVTGKVFCEPVAIYQIAMDATPDNARRLRSLAIWHGRVADQLAVYLVHADGVAEFVNLGGLVTA